MDRGSSFTVISAITLSIVSIVLSAVALARITRFSLPCPLYLPMLNLILSVLASTGLLTWRTITARLKHGILSSPMFRSLSSATTFLPFVLLILSAVFSTPSQMLRCTGEQRWLQMFRARDETAVRTIQNAFRCCGFNSVRDRAWPFPSRDSHADACLQTFHYDVPCAELWYHQALVAAGMVAFASFLNWIVLMTLVSNMQDDTSWLNHGLLAPFPPQGNRVRLIEESVEHHDSQGGHTHTHHRFTDDDEHDNENSNRNGDNDEGTAGGSQQLRS